MSPIQGNLEEDSMGLVITVTDRTNQDLDQVSDKSNTLHRLLAPENDEAFPVLRLVDLYGYTVFTHQQAPSLLKELLRLRDSAASHEERSLLDSIISLAAQVNDSVFLYLRFKGD